MSVDGKVHLTHPETGGEFLAPAESLPLWQARGWVASEEVPGHFDPDAPNSGAVPEGLEAAGAADPDAADIDEAAAAPPGEEPPAGEQPAAADPQDAGDQQDADEDDAAADGDE